MKRNASSPLRGTPVWLGPEAPFVALAGARTVLALGRSLGKSRPLRMVDHVAARYSHEHRHIALNRATPIQR